MSGRRSPVCCALQDRADLGRCHLDRARVAEHHRRARGQRRGGHNVADMASRLRYIVTPSMDTTVGIAGSRPAVTTWSSHDSPASKSTGTRCSRSAARSPSASSRSRFQAEVAGASISKTCVGPSCRCAKVSSPAPRMTYCVAPEALTTSSASRERATIDARLVLIRTGSISGRCLHESSTSAIRSPSMSSRAGGDWSTSMCRARHSAVRTAVGSGVWSAGALTPAILPRGMKGLRKPVCRRG